MATQITLESAKTYSTEARAVKAAQDHFGHIETLRFFVQCGADGRFFPVFISEQAVVCCVHLHFPVIA